MLPRVSLSAFLILVLSLANAAQAFDRTCAQNQGAQKQGARCAAEMTTPETVVYGTLSDHGMAYDAQGNPVDRHGNIVAVPAARSGSGREVFVQEPAFRR
jgi:hypothetical protein